LLSPGVRKKGKRKVVADLRFPLVPWGMKVSANTREVRRRIEGDFLGLVQTVVLRKTWRGGEFFLNS